MKIESIYGKDVKVKMKDYILNETPNDNGVIFNRESVIESIERYKATMGQHDLMCVELNPTFIDSDINRYLTVDIENVMGMIKYIDTEKQEVTIKPYKDYMDLDYKNYEIDIRGIGDRETDGIVNLKRIVSFDLYKK